MRNFVPERVVRATGRMERMNIDDGDMWICEFESPAMASIQSSYVTVGNYPGIEARIYGSEGAVIVRLVEERGICQTIQHRDQGGRSSSWSARSPRAISRLGARAARRGRSLFYSNLVRDFADEILSGGEANQGDFAQGALVQRTINAFERAARERRWVALSEVAEVAGV